MPIQQLHSWLEGEVEKNPVIKLPNYSCVTGPIAEHIEATISLHDYLISQAREFFSDKTLLGHFSILVGCMDNKGFIDLPHQELAEICKTSEKQIARLLKILQTFDPPGIGARNTQESLLIQLRHKGREDSITYKIIEKHFHTLLQSQFLILQRILKKSPYEIQRTLQKDLQPLSFSPAQGFIDTPTPYIQPDLGIEFEEGVWKVKVLHSQLPPIELVKVSKEDTKDLRPFITDAKLLQSAIERRKKTLQAIGIYLVKNQADFFSGVSELKAIDIKSAARDLGLHESTLFRAISEKYLYCSKGTMSLKSFFTKTLFKNTKTSASQLTVLETLKRFIDEEDKQTPLSDEELMQKLTKADFPCARRTVAKYRKKLCIGSRKQRRQFAKDKSTIL